MGVFDHLMGSASPMWAPPLPATPALRGPAEDAKHPLPTGAHAAAGLSAGAAPAKMKQPQADESALPVDEGEQKATRRHGGGRFATARGTGKGYMSPKKGGTKQSARFAAMSAREAEAERAKRQHELTRRESARRSARKAIESRPLLPTTSPPPAQWRKYPAGRPGAVQVDHVWEAVDEAYEEEREAAGRAGRPPMKQVQRREAYGSQRPLSAKERQYQLEKQLENRARRQLDAWKADQKEKAALRKHEQKERELTFMRAPTKSDLRLKKERAQELRNRLYAVQEREAAWRQRIAA